MPIYLDYNATAPIRPEVRDLAIEAMESTGNASSGHGFGRAARKYVEDARLQVADLCGVDSDQVTFNSGATEGINTVLSHYKEKRVLISAIEHSAVLYAAPHSEKVAVTKDGIIDLDALETALKEKQTDLICVMLVNSETGVIQPVKEAADLAHQYGSKILVDAVQGAGRLDMTMHKLGADYMALSAHKMAGPQGIGALITKKGIDIPRFMLGGGQEKNCRAGTHNNAGIAGMGLAAEIAKAQMKNYETITELRDYLEQQVRSFTNKVVIYGETASRVGNTSNIGLNGMEAQTQLMALDLDGIAVSSGSACSSGSFKPSHVLAAMGASETEAKSALRISLGWNTNRSDIDAFLESYKKILSRV
ncbi:MAG: cysteine desulfurase family protein [Pseudomonadota bacterium]